MSFLSKKQCNNSVIQLPISTLRANPNQPRTYFDPKGLAELALSIKQHGILQPLSVRKVCGQYELIAGERRLKAARLANLSHVPCIVIDASDEQSAVLALIENLQRRDLDFFETADGYRKLMECYGLTQTETAVKVGKSQSAVANKLRLLKYSPREMEFIRKSDLTERHARAVLRIEDEMKRFDVLYHIATNNLTVRDSEAYIDTLLSPKTDTPPLPQPVKKVKSVRKRRFTPLVRDVRIFVNSVNHAVDVMRKTGINASFNRHDSESEITLTVHIPKTAFATKETT